jgi:hypothetical protein
MRKLGVLAVGLTAAATMLLGAGAASAATTSTAVPDSTNCAPPYTPHRVCLEVDTSTNPLFVQSATVTNWGEPTGYGWIENMGDGVKHRSPTQLQAGGQSWTYAVNRAVANNDRWCGWIGSNPNEMACDTVHNWP